MEGVPSEEMSMIKPITSEELKKLFNSLKVDYPDDSVCESFVRQIIQDGMLKKMVTAVKSLSKGVVLTKYIPTRRRSMPTVEACVLEVDVVNDEQHFVIIKDASSNGFFNVNEDYRTRVILIKSKYVPKEDAKRTVFINFEQVFNNRQPVIILQHEDDEFDNVAKFIAYQILSQFCTFIESVINAFTIDLPNIISNYPENLLTVEKIHHLCLEVLERIEDEATLSWESKRDWKRLVADEIQKNILTKGEPICADIWVKINTICQKTVQDLTAILHELEAYQARVLPIDQNKEMKELLEKKFKRDYYLEKAPKPITKYIPGYTNYMRGLLAMGGGGGSNKQPNVGQTKISENVEARAVDEASSIKKELDSGQTEIIKAEAKEEGSSIKKDLDSGQTKIMDTAVTSREMSKFDPEMSSFKPITSEQLRKLFSSFKVEYPAEDPLSQSFVHQIIQDGMLRNLVTAINSLSKGIDLSKNLHTRKHDMPTVEAYVFEVDVVYDRDQFRVIRKDASSNEFFIENEDYLTRVILIKSKSLPVIDAKLMVYKKYKHVILKRRIILQHEYEEIDEVAKCIAYQILSSFCCFVESVRNAFKIDLRKIISDYPDKFLHVEKIKRLCLEAFENIADEAVVPLERKREWKQWVADKIKRNILAKGDPLCPDAWTKIRNICRKTLQDLTTISKQLEELKNNVLPVDQNKQIDEWLKREVIKDKASLYPSIIKCIAGQRGDKNIVKVYLSGGNTEEAKEAIKKECKLAITDFEFVNIEEITEMLKDVQKIKALEREAPEIDIATREDLERIIRKHTDKLYASYSNIIGIRIGRRVHGDKLEKPCIIFYCLDKSLIPFGEKKIPDSLEGWPCDVREDFIMLGCCTENCRTTTADYPELGCSIGRPSDKGFGSVGFMFESEDSKKYGFLTAAHVAIENYQQLHTGNNLLSEHPLRNKIHDIVHPSWTDNEYNDHTVGQVMEAFYGNYTSLPGGLDFAAIKTNCKKKDKEDIEVFNEDKTISSKRVRKTGRTTGLTFGLLSNKMESICFEKPPGSGNRLPFYNLYVVKKIAEEDPLFFKPGDSGSGVFVVEDGKQDKALGIGIAIGIISQETYVCKIANILKTLGLKLVRYREDNQEQTLPSTKEM